MLVFFVKIAVGVRESAERDQSAPAQTASQQARFGSDWSAGWLSVLIVVVQGEDMGHSTCGSKKALDMLSIETFLLRVVGGDAPDSFTAYYYWKSGNDEIDRCTAAVVKLPTA